MRHAVNSALCIKGLGAHPKKIDGIGGSAGRLVKQALADSAVVIKSQLEGFSATEAIQCGYAMPQVAQASSKETA